MKTDLAKLVHLVTVADLRSYGRAARQLNITQPALSRSISNLEERIGIKVLDRGRGGVSVTKEGAEVIREARLLLRRTNDFEHNIGLHQRGEAGKVSLAIAPLIASIMLAELVERVHETYPAIDLDVTIQGSRDVVELVTNDAVDLAIVPVFRNHALDSSLSAEILFPLKTAVITRAGHPLTLIEDLTLQQVWDYRVSCGDRTPEFEARSGLFVCNNYNILKDLTLNTDMAWLSSILMVEPEISDGRLVPVLSLDSIGRESYCAVVQRPRLHRKSIHKVMDEISAIAARY